MDTYRVVLADDHALMREGIRKILEEVEDLEVIGEAGDGQELLALLERSSPHLVLIDLGMPNLGGLEAVGEIKQRHPALKVLVLTMYREFLRQAMKAGADGYVLKEDACRELFSAIEYIRAGKVYISPHITIDLLGNGEASQGILSPRELEVLLLIAKGKSNREVAESILLSVRTVENHRRNIMIKLNLKNTAELVQYAIRKGYL